MNKYPLVSVIVNCHNSEAYLKECIKSILNQTYIYFELIFIDNQSTDKTSQIISSYSDDRIKYFKTPNYLPLGSARNIGLNYAKGVFISFLDSDDIWHKNKLSHSIPVFKKDVEMVYSNVTYFSKSYSFELYEDTKSHQGNCFKDLIENYTLCMSSCIFTNKIITKNKIKFDEKLKVCEDSDFFLKIALKSKIKYLDEILVKYRIHSENLTNTKRYLFFDENKYIINSQKTLDKKFKEKLLSKNFLDEAKYDWKAGLRSRGTSKILLNKKLKTFYKIFYFIIFFIPFRYVSKIYQFFFKRVSF